MKAWLNGAIYSDLTPWKKLWMIVEPCQTKWALLEKLTQQWLVKLLGARLLSNLKLEAISLWGHFFEGFMP